MRASQGFVLTVLLSGTLVAQTRVPGAYPASPGGFGSVLYPGTGGPPAARTGNGNISFPSRLGATVQGRGYGGYRGAPQMVNPGRSRTIVVPYAFPVVVNGTPQDEYLAQQSAQQAMPQQMPQQSPTVIINQTFVPETLHPMVREYPPDVPTMSSGPQGGMRGYEAPVGDPSVERLDAAAIADRNRPTIYQIAFKSGTTYSSVAYWMDGDTLNYVTPEGSLNRASLDLIDRPLSEQLNRERHVEFHLPK